MPKLPLDIPDDVADALRLPPDGAEQEVRKELAVTLYARQLLPLGKARQLAGLSRRDFTDSCASPNSFTGVWEDRALQDEDVTCRLFTNR